MKNNSDLSAIREQLLAFQSETPFYSGDTHYEEDLRSPALPFSGREGPSDRQLHQTDMVQALRQRSPQPTQHPSPEEQAASGSSATIPPGINLHLRRLQEEAARINELSRQQEIAIQKFQRSVKGLDVILLRQQTSGIVLRREQFCELQDAALTQVIQDRDGRYILTAVDVDLNIDEQQASQNAAEVRAFQQGHSQHRRRTSHSLQSFLSEPVAMLEGLWHGLTGKLESRSQITPLDILVWCGGGLIGRLALDLALAMTPGLWPWIVGITVGAVALGLYRLLFSQQTDTGFILRLFLALVGLAIGGQI